MQALCPNFARYCFSVFTLSSHKGRREILFCIKVLRSSEFAIRFVVVVDLCVSNYMKYRTIAGVVPCNIDRRSETKPWNAFLKSEATKSLICLEVLGFHFSWPLKPSDDISVCCYSFLVDLLFLLMVFVCHIVGEINVFSAVLSKLASVI